MHTKNISALSAQVNVKKMWRAYVHINNAANSKKSID